MWKLANLICNLYTVSTGKTSKLVTVPLLKSSWTFGWGSAACPSKCLDWWISTDWLQISVCCSAEKSEPTCRACLRAPFLLIELGLQWITFLKYSFIVMKTARNSMESDYKHSQALATNCIQIVAHIWETKQSNTQHSTKVALKACYLGILSTYSKSRTFKRIHSILSHSPRKTLFSKSVSLTDLLFVFSSEAVEERYEYKTRAHIQEMVRVYELFPFRLVYKHGMKIVCNYLYLSSYWYNGSWNTKCLCGVY